MIDSLHFVKGAVARKNIVPALQHFRIQAGKIKSFNGALSLCSPIPLELDCQPKAIQMIKAIESCKDTVQLHLTPTGRLSVKSGKFKAFIECDPSDNFPDVKPEGEKIELVNGGLMKMFKKLEPLIGEDMSRAWSRGILLRDDFAFVTNNVILVQYWLGYKFPRELVIPHEAVNELLRIGEEPEAMSIATGNVTFHFPNGRWLRTQTFSTEWPDVNKVLNRDFKPALEVKGTDFFAQIATLVPFADDLSRLLMLGDRVATAVGDGQGASVDIPNVADQLCLNINQVLLLKGIADRFDFQHSQSGPVLFAGENLRGGMSRMNFEFPKVA